MFFTQYARDEKSKSGFKDMVGEMKGLGEHYFEFDGKEYLVRNEDEKTYVSREVIRVEMFEDPVSRKEKCRYVTVARG